jgi:hypothetical protein
MHVGLDGVVNELTRSITETHKIGISSFGHSTMVRRDVYDLGMCSPIT